MSCCHCCYPDVIWQFCCIGYFQPSCETETVASLIGDVRSQVISYRFSIALVVAETQYCD